MFNLFKIQLKIKCQELYDENIELKKQNEELLQSARDLHNIKKHVRTPRIVSHKYSTTLPSDPVDTVHKIPDTDEAVKDIQNLQLI